MRSIAAGLPRVAFAMLLGSSPAHAQYEAGRRFAGPRIGLAYVGTAPNFGAQFEIAREDRIGIGGFVDYWSYNYAPEPANANVTYLAFGAAGSYHFKVEDVKWDPFLGLSLGYYAVSYGIAQDYGGGFPAAGSSSADREGCGTSSKKAPPLCSGAGSAWHTSRSDSTSGSSTWHWGY